MLLMNSLEKPNGTEGIEHELKILITVSSSRKRDCITYPITSVLVAKLHTQETATENDSDMKLKTTFRRQLLLI